MTGTPQAANGRISAIRGAVVDVLFEQGSLPAINDALRVEEAESGAVVLEVHGHLDPHHVRCVALQTTSGLRRG